MLFSWDEEHEDILIELWRENPQLYNVNLKSYHNKASKNKLYEEISKTLGCTVKDVMVRMSSLRSAFGRLCKAGKSGGPGKPLSARKKWLNQQLEFLANYIKPWTSRSNLEDQEPPGDEAELDEEEEVDHACQDEDTLENEIEDTTECTQNQRASTPNPDVGTSMLSQEQIAEVDELEVESKPASALLTKRPIPTKTTESCKTTKGKSSKAIQDQDEKRYLKSIAISLEERSKQRRLSPNTQPPTSPGPAKDEIAIFSDHVQIQLRSIGSRRRRLQVQHEMQEILFKAVMEDECRDHPEVSATPRNNYLKHHVQMQAVTIPTLSSTNAVQQYSGALTPINYGDGLSSPRMTEQQLASTNGNLGSHLDGLSNQCANSIQSFASMDRAFLN